MPIRILLCNYLQDRWDQGFMSAGFDIFNLCGSKYPKAFRNIEIFPNIGEPTTSEKRLNSQTFIVAQLLTLFVTIFQIYSRNGTTIQGKVYFGAIDSRNQRKMHNLKVA